MSDLNFNFSKKISLTCLPLDGYAIVEKIGAGSYSTVYKGFKKTGHREAVAIKCVEKSKLSPSGIENIITEISMMKMLKHKYIVQMKEFQWDDRLPLSARTVNKKKFKLDFENWLKRKPFYTTLDCELDNDNQLQF